MSITANDLNDLKRAKSLLDNPGLAAKLTNLIGLPIEKGFELLPKNWSKSIGEITKTALMKAAKVSTFTMKNTPGEGASNIIHKLAVAASGGIGGFFGLPALAVELPISTAIMLRSIADIARSEGENINNIETKAACIEVFGLGGRSGHDDATESGYFAVRAALARAVSESAESTVGKGLKEGAPALVRLIIRVAERFNIQVSEKVAAQAIPAIGAAGGALINTLFIDHFQDMARGHFIVRRLESKYGNDLVKEAYMNC